MNSEARSVKKRADFYKLILYKTLFSLDCVKIHFCLCVPGPMKFLIRVNLSCSIATLNACSVIWS